MTEHLTAEARREQVAEILVTGIFRLLADRAVRASLPEPRWKPARIEVPDQGVDDRDEAEPCH